MRKILVLLVLIILGLDGLAQINLKHNGYATLNETEYKLLDSILQKKRKTFSFKNKKAAFVTGHSFMILDKFQKKDSGGYDVIIYRTPKIMKKQQIDINLQKLKNTSKTNY